MLAKRNKSARGAISSPGGVNTSFLNDSILPNGKYSSPLIFFESDFLKELAVPDMRANNWSKKFSTTEQRTARVAVILSCKKLCAKVFKFFLMSIALKIVVQKTYFSRQYRHIAYIEEKKHQKNELVEQTNAQLHI